MVEDGRSVCGEGSCVGCGTTALPVGIRWVCVGRRGISGRGISGGARRNVVLVAFFVGRNVSGEDRFSVRGPEIKSTMRNCRI